MCVCVCVCVSVFVWCEWSVCVCMLWVVCLWVSLCVCVCVFVWCEWCVCVCVFVRVSEREEGLPLTRIRLPSYFHTLHQTHHERCRWAGCVGWF